MPSKQATEHGDKRVRNYSPHYLTPSRWRVADQETGAPAGDRDALIRRQNTTRAGRRRHKEQGDRIQERPLSPWDAQARE